MLEGSLLCVCVYIYIYMYVYIYMMKYQKTSFQCIYGFSTYSYNKKVLYLIVLLFPYILANPIHNLKHQIAEGTFSFPVDT